MLRRTKGRPVEALGVGRIAAFLLFVEVFSPNCTKRKSCVRLPQGDGAMEWSRLVSSALSLARGPHTARRDKVRSNCRSWRAEDHSEPVASILAQSQGGAVIASLQPSTPSLAQLAAGRNSRAVTGSPESRRFSTLLARRALLDRALCSGGAGDCLQPLRTSHVSRPAQHSPSSYRPRQPVGTSEHVIVSRPADRRQ